MPQRIVGIDVGSWSVKAVVVESSFRTFKVLTAKEFPIGPSLASDVTDESETASPTHRDQVEAALLAASEDPELRGDMTIAAVAGNVATTRWVTLPFSDPRKVDQVLHGELADLLPFDVDDAVVDHTLFRKSEGSCTSMAAAVPIDRLRDTLSLLQESGIEPRFLPLDVFQLAVLHGHYLAEDGTEPELPHQPAAEAETFIQPVLDGPPEARLLVDIGHERTVVTACNQDGIHLTRVLRTGGADVTRALAEAYQVDMGQAEAGKHEQAFVASSRHPAPDDEHQQMSDAIEQGLKTLIRELRRTLQLIRKERKVSAGRIDLMGGGSRIRNLAAYLAEQLNLPVARAAVVEQAVERHVDNPRRPAFALALALALRQTGGFSPKIDFRVGEFAYAGQLEFLRERIPTIAISAGILLFLSLVSVAVQYRGIVQREARVDAQFCAVTKEVVGREICEPALAVTVMQRPDSELGSFELPQRSAFAMAAELSERVPEDLEIRLETLDVNSEVARVSGTADSFDAVDQLVGAYSDSPCLSDIKKSKISKSAAGNGVDFQLNMKVTCS